MLVTLLVKFRNKDCKTTELGLLLQVLLFRIVTFVETLGSHLKCHPNLHFYFSIFATFFATFLAILFAGSKRGHVTERKEAKLSCYEFSFVSFFKIVLVQVSILTRSSAKQLINYLIAWLSEFFLILR